MTQRSFSVKRDLIRLPHIAEIFHAIPYSNLCVLPRAPHFTLRGNFTGFDEALYGFFTEPFITPDSEDKMKKIFDNIKTKKRWKLQG